MSARETHKLEKSKAHKSLKARSSGRKLDPGSWKRCWRGRSRISAVNRGVDYIQRLSYEGTNFEDFGNDTIQVFYDIAKVSGWGGETLRRKCLMYLEQQADRWQQNANLWKEASTPTPREIIDAVTSMYALERAALPVPMNKTEVLKFIATSSPPTPLSPTSPSYRYTSKDLIGWDPLKEPPPDNASEICEGCGRYNERGRKKCKECYTALSIVSKYRMFSNAIINCFFADHALVPLGAHSFRDIFAWLPTLRPYVTSTQVLWDTFWQQCYMVTHIVFTLSNWGELSLDPILFVHEHQFLRGNVHIHIAEDDVHLVAESLECMRILGDSDDDPLVQECSEWLMSKQNTDGSWDPEDESPRIKFHATMCAVQGLMVHKQRGQGPGIVEVLPLLEKWHKEDIESGRNGEGALLGTGGIDFDFSQVRQFEVRSKKLVQMVVGANAHRSVKHDSDNNDDRLSESRKSKKKKKKKKKEKEKEKEKEKKEKVKEKEKGSKSETVAASSKKTKKRKVEPSIENAEVVESKRQRQNSSPILVIASKINDFVSLERKAPEASLDSKRMKTLLRQLTELEVPNGKKDLRQVMKSLLGLRSLCKSTKSLKSQILVNKVLARWAKDTTEGRMANAALELGATIEKFEKSESKDAEAASEVMKACSSMIPKKGTYDWKGLSESRCIYEVKHLHKCKSKKLKKLAKQLFEAWTSDLGDPPKDV